MGSLGCASSAEWSTRNFVSGTRSVHLNLIRRPCGQMILKIILSVMQVQQIKDNQQGFSKRRRRRRH
jgi:hypothetical protein